jgi:sulfoxide reductase heme-binding subunit YedZ
MPKPRFTPLQILVHLAGWFPAAQLLYGILTDNLTANPIQRLEQVTGINALTFLLFSLACTPLASVFGWKELLLRRKALGNYGFLYAALHVTIFIAIDYGLNLNRILRDVGTKWYILIGLLAFLLLVPLAFTSFTYWMKRLGRNWKRLHRLVYFISPLVILHFLLSVKGNLGNLSGNISQPVLYGAIAAILLLLRISPLKRALIQLRTRFSSAVKQKLPPLKKSAAVTRIESE